MMTPVAAVGPIAVVPMAAVGPIAVVPIAAVTVAAVVTMAANSHSHRRVAVAGVAVATVGTAVAGGGYIEEHFFLFGAARRKHFSCKRGRVRSPELIEK